MCGLPGQTKAFLRRDIENAADMDVHAFTAYSLRRHECLGGRELFDGFWLGRSWASFNGDGPPGKTGRARLMLQGCALGFNLGFKFASNTQPR
jgi:hypothetical protein